MTAALDRRIKRTRKLVQEALFSLMAESPYQKIRISQIADRADISRSTFYLHYQTKDDLLLSSVDEIIDEYFKTIDQPNREDKHSPALLLFSKWKQNIAKMRMILDAGMEYRIYQRLRVFNKQRAQSVESDNKLLDDYIRTMLDGASFALLLRWTQDNAHVPVEQMEALFDGLNITGLFKELGRKMPNFGVEKGN
jgi:AcrR family transcriptional regulator